MYGEIVKWDFQYWMWGQGGWRRAEVLSENGTDGAGILKTDTLAVSRERAWMAQPGWLGTGWDVALLRVQLLCVGMVAGVLPSLLQWPLQAGHWKDKGFVISTRFFQRPSLFFS